MMEKETHAYLRAPLCYPPQGACLQTNTFINRNLPGRVGGPWNSQRGYG